MSYCVYVYVLHNHRYHDVILKDAKDQIASPIPPRIYQNNIGYLIWTCLCNTFY